MSTPQDTLNAALAWHTAGASVVRACTTGSKAPLGQWKPYQEERPDESLLHAWFDGGHPGLGVVLGEVSGGLEMIEFEGRAVDEGLPAEFGEIVEASGLGDVWDAIKRGYCERTPSGGYHLIYRVTGGPVLGNTKLARRPATAAELEAAPGARVQVLIETRGQGGFVVTAPSHGPVHPSGRPWELLAGGPGHIATIDVGERDALFAVARMLDEMPQADQTPALAAAPADEADAFLFGTVPASAVDSGGLSPLDDFEQRTAWADILKPHGWQLLFTSGHTSYWRRPGKNVGVSATTGRDAARDRLFVFSSSTEFEQETPYTKPGAYALLEHGGDHSAAARELRRRGYGAPRDAPRHLSVVPTPGPATDGTAALHVDEPAPDSGPATYSRTDDGNALRLVDAHADEIRYCPARGWLTWDGHRWIWDERGHVAELARDIARALPEGEGDLQHKARSLSARGLESMVKVARTDPRVVTPIATLDANPWQLNTPAGVIDLRTGEISAPDPQQLHTRSTSTAPDFEQPAARWHQFLADTFGNDSDLITYVQRLLGLSLIGAVTEQLLPFAFGEGANGKSTLADTVMRIVGIGETGYSISAPSEMLLASSASNHPTEIARLAGARFVVASELDDGQRFAEARIKMLTGRDIITGRFMRQDFFSFAPTHTLWLLGNHRPAVRTGGPAFWRRLRLVPFLNTVPEHLRDTGLEEHLVDREGPAILAWLIRGAADYARDGLTTPAAVQTATEEYQGEQDTVGRFLDDMCTLGIPGTPGMQTPSGALLGAYTTWCEQEGEEPASAKKFAGQIKKRGVQIGRTKSVRFYDGVSLRTGGAR
ncbi:phage/plasmid primase, P4 family [Streptomyces sp. MNP-20]|uniref:phage/plasmid primase, P4 family n=1 Tax=Streptomyces sp. MNP-20 TaxID=2721165 RepID=UPI001556B2F8|nr:phage/plasmid primase, P4 family [Streptomyces sp. MNP-20]